MKILKTSISLLLGLGGAIGLVSYATSCSCSNSKKYEEKPFPFTIEYFN
jgi:hypothetical protein